MINLNKMTRRDFLRIASLAGVSLGLPDGFLPIARPSDTLEAKLVHVSRETLAENGVFLNSPILEFPDLCYVHGNWDGAIFNLNIPHKDKKGSYTFSRHLVNGKQVFGHSVARINEDKWIIIFGAGEPGASFSNQVGFIYVVNNDGRLECPEDPKYLSPAQNNSNILGERAEHQGVLQASNHVGNDLFRGSAVFDYNTEMRGTPFSFRVDGLDNILKVESAYTHDKTTATEPEFPGGLTSLVAEVSAAAGKAYIAISNLTSSGQEIYLAEVEHGKVKKVEVPYPVPDFYSSVQVLVRNSDIFAATVDNDFNTHLLQIPCSTFDNDDPITVPEEYD
ncbi:hypothetical protein KY320_01940, partial [Candidatus Woesearchaeota archaeon]|nr:hypothetical protein [Candidatus Woesearchaeota archaeon]